MPSPEAGSTGLSSPELTQARRTTVIDVTAVADRRLRSPRRPLTGLAVAACLAAVACGGDGGSTNPTAVASPGGALAPAGPGYTVSGTITVADSLTVDSDTNDPRQVGHRSNNNFSTVQPLPNPGSASGYLTVAGQGPEGAVKAAGDLVDGYSARLNAGQVIELDFSADPSIVDLDLFLYNSDRELVGRSRGTSGHECIRVVTTGDYTIGVEVFTTASRGGSLYQLRLSQPNSSRCANAQVSADTFIADQIVATVMPAVATTAGVMTKALATAPADGLAVLKAGAEADGGPRLLAVPADEKGLVQAYAAHLLPGADRDPAVLDAAVRAKADEAIQNDPLWRSGMSDQARRLRSAMDLAKTLVASGRYLDAQLNYRLDAFADRILPFPPDDREYSKQRWHYEAISLPAALAQLGDFAPAGGLAPIVAVVDSGIVADHPDLAGQLVAGVDFISDPDNGDGDGIDSNPDDSATGVNAVFHGTHVAGTIAARTWNTIGVAGVAPVARIMPLRVLAGGSGTFYDMMQAVRYAAGLSNDSRTVPPRRADIINLSLGKAGLACDIQLQQLFREVRATGAIVVAAAGNESTETQTVAVGSPANCPNVIAVGAVDAQLQRARYSNVGPEILVSAPGGDSRKSTTGTGQPDGVYSTVATLSGGRRLPSYAYMSGTSMAAPHVSGVLALMRWINPQLSPAAIEQWIVQGVIVDDLGAKGRDTAFGHGLINAGKAVVQARLSLGENVAAPAGQIVAQPTSLNLGSLAQTVEFNLGQSTGSGERIVSVTTDSASISVAPKAGAVDPSTGLGTYVVSANRAVLAPDDLALPNVLIQLAPNRTLVVPVSVERRQDAAGGGGGNAGPLYVLVLDATSTGAQAVAAQAQVTRTGSGTYSYTVTVPGTSRISIIAGSDLDNDGLVCSGGEACGAYPLLSGTLQVLEPGGNLSGIDFAVTPFAGINPLADLNTIRE